MKRNGPLITLLAGIGVAALLFLLSMQANRVRAGAEPAPAGTTASVAAEEPSAAPTATVPAGPTVARQPLAQQTTPAGTWAGNLKPGSLALSIKDGLAIAYFCDGKKAEAWLKGPVQNGQLTLTGKKGASLTGTVDKTRAKGKVAVGGKAWTFDIDAVTKPSGLYRAAADVRGAKVVGGWIVLKDGSQVGLATVGGQLATTSTLDVTTGRATVAGATVTAVPADPTQ